MAASGTAVVKRVSCSRPCGLDINKCLEVVPNIQYTFIFRFLKLPAFVRMIVTSRPEAEDMFKDWKPTLSIKPDEKNNMGDMKKLLDARITACKSISEGLRRYAVEIVLKKSKVSVVLSMSMIKPVCLRFGCLKIDTLLLLCIMISSGPVHICQICIHIHQYEDEMESRKAAGAA